MKKNWIFGVAVCGILSVSDSAYGQSIKDILNSAAVKDAVTAVTGGKKLTVENLAGTWTYVDPAIQLEGDNALKNVAASVASSEMEKKLKDYCAKIGIIEGAFNYTFNTDSTFTSVLKSCTLKGTYSCTSCLSSGIVGFSWPDVLQNAVIRCIALLFQEKHFR